VKIFTVVVEDTIKQRREYVTFGEDDRDARAQIAAGLFITESEAATVDTLETRFVSSEMIGTVE